MSVASDLVTVHDFVWEVEVDGEPVFLRRLTKAEWLVLVDLGKPGGLDDEEVNAAFAKLAVATIVSPTPSSDVVSAFPGLPAKVARILASAARGERVKDADRHGGDAHASVPPARLLALKEGKPVWTLDVGTVADAVVMRRLTSTEHKALRSKLEGANPRRSYVAMDRALKDALLFPTEGELDEILTRYPGVAVRAAEDLMRLAMGERVEHAKKA